MSKKAQLNCGCCFCLFVCFFLSFFLSKSLGGHAISAKNTCGVLPVNLIKLFYIGTPVVRTDGRWADLRSRDFSDGWITKFSKEWGAAREHK